MVTSIKIMDEIKGLPEPLIVHYSRWHRKLSLLGLKSTKRLRGAYINSHDLEWLIRSGKDVRIHYRVTGEDATIPVLKSILRKKFERDLQKMTLNEMMGLIKE